MRFEGIERVLPFAKLQLACRDPVARGAPIRADDFNRSLICGNGFGAFVESPLRESKERPIQAIPGIFAGKLLEQRLGPCEVLFRNQRPSARQSLEIADRIGRCDQRRLRRCGSNEAC